MTDNNGTPLPPSNDPYAAPPAPAGYAAPGAPGSTGEDPGKTLGIIGLVLAFLVNIAGLVVSIIARKKSKAAGYKNGFATAGIIVSIVSIVLGIIAAIVLIAALSAGLGSLAEQCVGLEPGLYETTDGQTVTCP